MKNLFIVPKKCFYPVPGVDSAVISLSSKDNLLDVDIDKFNSFVKNSFQFKRKNLRNNLRSYNLEKIEEILKKYNKDLTTRAENLSIEEFVEISNNI